MAWPRIIAQGVFAALTILLAFPASAAPKRLDIANDTFGTVAVYQPEGEVKAFFAVVSDEAGFTGSLQSDVEALTRQGALVAVFDPETVIAKLGAGTEKVCHYFFGDIEDVAHAAQREAGVTAFHWPVVIGSGDKGGLLAYLAIAQVPENTAAGAVSTGLATEIDSRLPFCAGAPSSRTADGKGFVYRGNPDMRASFALITPAAPGSDAAAIVAADPGNDETRVEPDPQKRFAAIIETALAYGAPPVGDIADLPLIPVPADGQPKALVVFFSGDGGWRDIDLSISEHLSTHGVAVVGVDSLRYFWANKTPEAIARDIERIITYYSQKWQVKTAALAGYSFGADILPFAYQKLDRKTQDAVRLVAMLGLEPMASFEISVSGYIGLANSDDVDIRPALAALPSSKAMCIYGTNEKNDGETACTLPELADATLIERPGGHHFDGDYDAVAALLLKRLVAP